MFEDASEGKLTLIVSPLRRLISKNNATIRDVGPPESVLGSVGAFITGTSPPDDEDVVRCVLSAGVTSSSGSKGCRQGHMQGCHDLSGLLIIRQQCCKKWLAVHGSATSCHLQKPLSLTYKSIKMCTSA